MQTSIAIGHVGGLDSVVGADGVSRLEAVPGQFTTIINIDNDDSAQANGAAIRSALTSYHFSDQTEVRWCECGDANLRAQLVDIFGFDPPGNRPGEWDKREVAPTGEDHVQATEPEPAPEPEPEADVEEAKPAKKAAHPRAKAKPKPDPKDDA